MADGTWRMVDAGRRPSISHPRFAISHQPLAIFGVAVAFGVLLAACHPLPAHPAPPAPPALPALVRDIDALLAAPALAHGYWGVLVTSLKTGETLYALNAKRLMMPASNMKIVTLAAAAERLGWNYTYETALFAAGTTADGTLRGDLVAAGSGDPSLTTAAGDALFAEWADALKRAGIRTVTGRVIGDDNAFEDNGLGF